MNKTIETVGSLSLADTTFLQWYEITNALSHSHINTLFTMFQRTLERKIKRNGSPDLPTTIYIRCFCDVASKVAHMHTTRRYESIVMDCEENAV